MTDAAYKPTPQELFNQAGGDLEKYRNLLIHHGLMIKHDNTKPEPHPFTALTRTCLCSVCHGTFGASWHAGTPVIGDDFLRLSGSSDEPTDEF